MTRCLAATTGVGVAAAAVAGRTGMVAMSAQVGTRRVRSEVDGILRHRCECGRLIALDEDWTSNDINEGDRDDLCWAYGANHELEYPEPSR